MGHDTENNFLLDGGPAVAVAQQLFEHAPVAMLVVDLEGAIQHLNSSAEQLFGYSKETLIGKQVEILVPGGLQQKHKLLRDSFFSVPSTRPMGKGRRLSALHKDGHLIPVEIGLNPVTIGSQPTVVVVSVLDHSALDRAERAEFFVSELTHRARNMFTVISAISHQIGAVSPDRAGFESAFDNRLRSFGASYGLFARDNWQIPLIADLVRAQLAFINQQDAPSITMEGPELRLSINQSEYLSLAIHELATNAVKYGALSVKEGKVHIRWAVDATRQSFQIYWQERNGPVVAQPQRKGFGLVILETVVPAAFGGTAVLSTPAKGVSWLLDAPMAMILANE